MSAPGTLLPILEEAEWSGGSLVAAERLVRDDVLYVPLVAYGYDGASSRKFVTLSALEEEGRALASVAKEAAENLRRRAIGLRPREDGALLAIDEYASSLLAVPSELERIRETLGAEAILLSAPTRGLLVAAAADDAGDRGLSRFARETFASALEARITPLVFAWDGEALSVHLERVGEVERASIEELSYDEEDERLALRLHGDALPSVVRAIDRLLRNGKTDDGRPVADLVIEATPRACPTLSTRFGAAIELLEIVES